MNEFAHRRALGAVRTAVDRAIPGRLLADPDAVLNFGDHGAADRAMRADVLSDVRRRADDFRAGLRLAHRPEPHPAPCSSRTRRETRPAPEGAAATAYR